MIFGCVADTDGDAARVLELISATSGTAVGAVHSVRSGVGLGWHRESPFADSIGQLDSDSLFEGWPERRGQTLDSTRGDFSLIARHQGNLVLVRGPFGGRPLYTARLRSAIVACSRLAPLVDLLRGEITLDVVTFSSLLMPTASESRFDPPFEGFSTVRTGTISTINIARRRDEKLSVAVAESTLEDSTYDLAQRLRDELAAVVAKMMTADRPVVVMAGGGVDSSLLLALAVKRCRETGGRVLPISFSHGGRGDDRPHMRALVDHLGVAAIATRPDEGTPREGRDRIVDASIHLVLPTAFVNVALEKAWTLGARTALSGEGSELLLDASTSVLAGFAWASPLQAMATLFNFQDINQTAPRSWRTILSTIARWRAPRFMEAVRGRGEWRPPLPAWSGPRLRAIAQTAIANAGWQTPCDQRERVRRAAYSPFLAQAAESRSRFEQLTGMRIRVPYLDAAFTDFAARIPTHAMFAGGRERGILREAMSGLVPDSVRTRMTKGRPEEAFREAYDSAGGFEMIRHLADVRELDALGLVDRHIFRRELDRFAANPGDDLRDWYRLWPVLAAENFVRWVRQRNGGGLAAA